MRKKNAVSQPNIDNTKKPPSKKNKIKIEKRKITVDEILIQAAIIMVNTVADTKREGATVRFETESNGENYNVDIIIKKVEKEKPEMKKV